MKASSKMANPNVNNIGSISKPVEVDYETPILSHPFDYRPGIDQAKISGLVFAGFCKEVEDVSRGVKTILKIMQDDQIRKDLVEGCDDVSPLEGRRIFAPCELESLQKLAIRSMDGLAEESDRLLTWAYEHHTEDGRKETARRAAFLAKQHQ